MIPVSCTSEVQEWIIGLGVPIRKQALATGEIYHVFNRGIDKRATFLDSYDYERAIKTLGFYVFQNFSMRLSRFLELNHKNQRVYLSSVQGSKPLVSIICYCLMPNHFHLLIRQESDNGVSKYMSNVLNSYTKYFNTRHERDGQLFKNQFKAVRIESEEQFRHVSRYIHLNPFSSRLVATQNDLLRYRFSSLYDLVSKRRGVADESILLNYFSNRDVYLRFVLDQAEYQRSLKLIDGLTFD